MSLTTVIIDYKLNPSRINYIRHNRFRYIKPNFKYARALRDMYFRFSGMYDYHR